MIADSILSLAMLIIISLLFYGPWQELCADIARQLMFEKRNLIFNFAQSGDLDFNSKEYRDIRNSLNLMIRFAHQATFPRLLFISACLYKTPISETSTLQNATGRVENPKLRNELRSIVDEAELIMILAAAARSVCFWILLPLIFVPRIFIWWLRSSRDKVIRRIRNVGERVQIEAECAE